MIWLWGLLTAVSATEDITARRTLRRTLAANNSTNHEAIDRQRRKSESQRLLKHTENDAREVTLMACRQSTLDNDLCSVGGQSPLTSLHEVIAHCTVARATFSRFYLVYHLLILSHSTPPCILRAGNIQWSGLLSFTRRESNSVNAR